MLGRFSKGIAGIEATVEPFANEWDRRNAEARLSDGPLWVVLGDSSSQGIGATGVDDSWVPNVLSRLQSQNEHWRVVNLAMSGGRFRDVADRQVPVLREFLPTPDLVTCVIGSNDLMWRRGTQGVVDDAQAVVEALPQGTLLSKLSSPGKRPGIINESFGDAERSGGVHLFNIWRWPSPKGAMAADKWHPSDIGYGHMANLAWDAITGHPQSPASK